MTETVKQKENRNMKLTGAEINKAYSEQLAKLLLDGYRLVIARENGSLEKNKDNNFAIVVLEKEGEKYEFGLWSDTINQKTGKYTLGLTEYNKYRWKYDYLEIKNLLENPFSYYYYIFDSELQYNKFGYFAFSTEEEALELYEKRKQRAEYRDWLRNRIVNTFKVAKTNYTGFKKDITVVSLPKTYILINKNGREAVLHKSTGRLSTY